MNEEGQEKIETQCEIFNVGTKKKMKKKIKLMLIVTYMQMQ